MTVKTNATGATGLDAYGLYANDGGTIDGSAATSVAVTTYGTGAIGVYASGDGRRPRRHAVDDHDRRYATITTNGASAAGVRRSTVGLATLGGGSVTTTARDRAGDRCQRRETRCVTLNGATLLTVTTTSRRLDRLYALGGGVTATGRRSTVRPRARPGSTPRQCDGPGLKSSRAATIATTRQGAARSSSLGGGGVTTGAQPDGSAAMAPGRRARARRSRSMARARSRSTAPPTASSPAGRHDHDRGSTLSVTINGGAGAAAFRPAAPAAL